MSLKAPCTWFLTKSTINFNKLAEVQLIVTRIGTKWSEIYQNVC